MGEAGAMGGNEGRFRRPAVSAVVQPFRWSPSPASAHGPRSEERGRVLRLSDECCLQRHTCMPITPLRMEFFLNAVAGLMVLQ